MKAHFMCYNEYSLTSFPCSFTQNYYWNWQYQFIFHSWQSRLEVQKNQYFASDKPYHCQAPTCCHRTRRFTTHRPQKTINTTKVIFFVSTLPNRPILPRCRKETVLPPPAPRCPLHLASVPFFPHHFWHCLPKDEYLDLASHLTWANCSFHQSLAQCPCQINRCVI